MNEWMSDTLLSSSPCSGRNMTDLKQWLPNCIILTGTTGAEEEWTWEEVIEDSRRKWHIRLRLKTMSSSVTELEEKDVSDRRNSINSTTGWDRTCSHSFIHSFNLGMDIQKQDETQVSGVDDQRKGESFIVRKGMMNLVLERLNWRCLWNFYFCCYNVWNMNLILESLVSPLHN